MVLRFLAHMEAREVEPTTGLENVKKAEEWAKHVSNTIPFRYGEISVRSGESDLHFLLPQGAPAKNFYSYVLGKLLHEERWVEKLLRTLRTHLKEYEEIGAFHATSSEHLEDIIRRGLLPTSKTGNQYEPIPSGGTRDRVHLFYASAVTAPDPNAVSRYLRFENGVPVIVGTALKAKDLEKVSLGGLLLEGDATAKQVPPEKITHILVPEKYVEEFRKRYPDKKVLPLEPFLVLLMLAKYGLTLWAHRDAEEVLKKYFRGENLHIERKGNEIRVKWRPQGKNTVRVNVFTLGRKLKPHHIDQLAKDPGIEVVGREDGGAVVHVNGLPVAVIRMGKMGNVELKVGKEAPSEVREAIRRFAETYEGSLEEMYTLLERHIARSLLEKIR